MIYSQTVPVDVSRIPSGLSRHHPYPFQRDPETAIKTSEKAVGPTILVHFQSVGIIFLTEYLLSIGWCDLWHGVGTLKGFIFIFIVVSVLPPGPM
jgi:hypothetical protein